MNIQRVLSVAVAACIGAGPILAQAQPRPDDRPPPMRDAGPGGPGGPDRGGPDRARPGPAPQANHNRQPQRQNNRPGAQQRDLRNGPNHPPPHHSQFRKGQDLPDRYRGHEYEVRDWRRQGLNAPPVGHKWVHVDNDFLLVSATTGLIVYLLTR